MSYQSMPIQAAMHKTLLSVVRSIALLRNIRDTVLWHFGSVRYVHKH
jgi:hypothetical protein